MSAIWAGTFLVITAVFLVLPRFLPHNSLLANKCLIKAGLKAPGLNMKALCCLGFCWTKEVLPWGSHYFCCKWSTQTAFYASFYIFSGSLEMTCNWTLISKCWKWRSGFWRGWSGTPSVISLLLHSKGCGSGRMGTLGWEGVLCTFPRFQSLIPTHNCTALALLESDEAAIHLQVWFGLLNKDNWKERISELFSVIFSLSIDDNFYRK